MYTTTLLTALLATTLAAASPTNPVKRQSTYYGISVEVRVTPLTSPEGPRYEPAPVEINKLNVFGNVSASELIIDPRIHSNIADINTVECRAYKDTDGVVPGSAPFTVNRPAELSTNLVEVGSVLCYIAEGSS